MAKRLLVCAQAIDRDDTAVSFIIGWVAELAERYEHITVLCLRKGEYTLPDNVTVVWLGSSNPVRTWNLWRESFKRAGQYDAVFVHQGQEFVLAAGWLWSILGKPIYLWRNHYAGSGLTSLAGDFCKKVFYTSKFSYTARFPNAVQMPVGVDTNLYAPVAGVARKPRSVLFYARMSPSKHPDVLIDALDILHKKGVEFTANFYGTPLPKDEAYLARLKERAAQLNLPVEFHPGRPYTEGPAIFSAHQVFVNLAASGMYDKMIFEAAACGCAVLASSEDWRELAGEQYYFKDTEDLAHKLEALLTAPDINLRPVVEKHSLKALMDGLRTQII